MSPISLLINLRFLIFKLFIVNLLSWLPVSVCEGQPNGDPRAQHELYHVLPNVDHSGIIRFEPDSRRCKDLVDFNLPYTNE